MKIRGRPSTHTLTSIAEVGYLWVPSEERKVCLDSEIEFCGRLPVGRIQIRIRTTPPHVPVQKFGVVPGSDVDLILIWSSVRPHASLIGRWIHTVSYRSNMPCQVPQIRAGDVAPRDVSLEWT